MTNFPKKAYGRSPKGHNPAPSGVTGNGNSTTQISADEEQPLFWSNYYQAYVDWMTLKQEPADDIIEEERSRRIREDEQFRLRAGFKKTI